MIRHYILSPNLALRGWKLLPYAVQRMDQTQTEFFREEDWALFSACDGQTEIDWDALGDDGLLRRLPGPGGAGSSHGLSGEGSLHLRILQRRVEGEEGRAAQKHRPLMKRRQRTEGGVRSCEYSDSIPQRSLSIGDRCGKGGI